MSLLRRDDLRRAAARRADGTGRSPAGRLRGAADGLLPTEQTRVALFLEQVLNQPCSPAWVVKLQDQATAPLRPSYDETAVRLPAEPVLGIDEWPTKEGRPKGGCGRSSPTS